MTEDTRIRVRSVLNPETGCMEWQGSKDRRGYGKVWVGSPRKGGKCVGAHRHAWILAHGPIPDGLLVCHSCDNPGCVNVAHLFLGTQADNIADMVSKSRGRGGRGERHRNAKLTAEQVIAIRADPRRECDIARAYGVAACTINQILHRKSWQHVA